LRVGDINGDGLTDLIYSSDSAYNMAYGNGSGGFQAPKQYGMTSTHFLELDDLNGDGRLDITLQNNANLLVTNLSEACTPN
jgi:hypothetical protein